MKYQTNSWKRVSSREDGMLFVRTEGILETMVRAPLLVAGLIVVVNGCQFRTHLDPYSES